MLEVIKDLLDILAKESRVMAIIKDELAAIRSEFATPRRTEIVDNDGEVEDEDLIQREDMVVTVSNAGYVKRVPLVTYRAQKRGGKGRTGMQAMKDLRGKRVAVESGALGAFVLSRALALIADGALDGEHSDVEARTVADTHGAEVLVGVDQAGRTAAQCGVV